MSIRTAVTSFELAGPINANRFGKPKLAGENSGNKQGGKTILLAGPAHFAARICVFDGYDSVKNGA